MNFKVVSDLELSKLYPNNYDENILKLYSLMDDGLNISFRYVYSCYHYFLDKYLEEVLDLNSLNQKVIESNAESNFSIVYNDISCTDLKYVFLRNNIFLDRLTREEYVEFVNFFNSKDIENLKKLVVKTYKKLIMFDSNLLDNELVHYDSFNKDCTTFNNALVIGVIAQNDSGLNQLIKQKELEYSAKLNLPIKIAIFNEESDKNDNNTHSKYLPLGSIVTLKNGIKKVMIMGYSAIDMDTKNDIYDYIACFYPEGVIRSDYNILFNHDDIHLIHALGFVDDEEKIFMAKIWDLIGSEDNQKEILNKMKDQNI